MFDLDAAATIMGVWAGFATAGAFVLGAELGEKIKQRDQTRDELRDVNMLLSTTCIRLDGAQQQTLSWRQRSEKLQAEMDAIVIECDQLQIDIALAKDANTVLRVGSQRASVRADEWRNTAMAMRKAALDAFAAGGVKS